MGTPALSADRNRKKLRKKRKRNIESQLR